MHSHNIFKPAVNLDKLEFRMLDLLKPELRTSALSDILDQLNHLNLHEHEAGERIYLMDTAIKTGSLEIVEKLSDMFIQQGYTDDIRIPSDQNMEHPYRPVFWLAAVVTRWDGIPEKNFDDIEAYLCQRFNIPTTVMINDVASTRDQYVDAVNEWKREQNRKLRAMGRSNDRYPIPGESETTRPSLFK